MCRGYEHIEDLDVATSEEKEPETAEIENSPDEEKPQVKIEGAPDDKSGAEVKEESEINMES